ncbi:hypothetical protein EI94DRAFT_1702005 [Lactarius quietus]|nr:hypothetical protein EI94DRAFT_1702005 [Lactarius quietus]
MDYYNTSALSNLGRPIRPAQGQSHSVKIAAQAHTCAIQDPPRAKAQAFHGFRGYNGKLIRWLGSSGLSTWLLYDIRYPRSVLSVQPPVCHLRRNRYPSRCHYDVRCVQAIKDISASYDTLFDLFESTETSSDAFIFISRFRRSRHGRDRGENYGGTSFYPCLSDPASQARETKEVRNEISRRERNRSSATEVRWLNNEEARNSGGTDTRSCVWTCEEDESSRGRRQDVSGRYSARIAGNINKAKRDQLQDKSPQWLSPANPSSNYELFYEGTATWFIQGTTFREWEVTSSLPDPRKAGLRQECPLVRIELALLISVD